MRNATKHSRAAFISSLACVEPLVAQIAPDMDINLRIDGALIHFNSVLEKDEDSEFTEEAVRMMSQKQLSGLIDEKLHHSLQNLLTSTVTRPPLVSGFAPLKRLAVCGALTKSWSPVATS